ncbi:MAG: sulfotransferase [Bacteroidota bacterium]
MKLNPLGKNLIYVMGAPRSSTTFLQAILDTHPEIYGGPELDYMYHIVNAFKKMCNSVDNGRITTYFPDREYLFDYYRRFLGEIYERKLNESGKKYFSEKTPFNTLYFKEYKLLFPEAKIIYIVRRPEEVIRSLKNIRHRAISFGQRPPTMAKDIFTSIKTIKDYYSNKVENSSSVLVLKYEDLQANKEEIVKQICGFIGIDFFPSMLNPEKQHHDADDVNDDLWFNKAAYLNKKAKGKKYASLELSRLESQAVKHVFADAPLANSIYNNYKKSTVGKAAWALLKTNHLIKVMM